MTNCGWKVSSVTNDKPIHLNDFSEQKEIQNSAFCTENENQPKNDFPDIDLSSVSMGVIELDTEEENLLN